MTERKSITGSQSNLNSEVFEQYNMPSHIYYQLPDFQKKYRHLLSGREVVSKQVEQRVVHNALQKAHIAYVRRFLKQNDIQITKEPIENPSPDPVLQEDPEQDDESFMVHFARVKSALRKQGLASVQKPIKGRRVNKQHFVTIRNPVSSRQKYLEKLNQQKSVFY